MDTHVGLADSLCSAWNVRSERKPWPYCALYGVLLRRSFTTAQHPDVSSTEDIPLSIVQEKVIGWDEKVWRTACTFNFPHPQWSVVRERTENGRFFYALLLI